MPSKALRDSFIHFSWICVTLKGTPRQLYTLLLDLCDPQKHSETALYTSLGSVWPSKALRDSFIHFSWICVTLKGTPRQLYTLLLDLCDPQRHSETALYTSLGSVWPSKALRDSFIHFSWICVTLKGTPRQLYTLLLDLCDPQRHSETALYTSLGSVWPSKALRDSFIHFSWICVNLKSSPCCSAVDKILSFNEWQNFLLQGQPSVLALSLVSVPPLCYRSRM